MATRSLHMMIPFWRPCNSLQWRTQHCWERRSFQNEPWIKLWMRKRRSWRRRCPDFICCTITMLLLCCGTVSAFQSSSTLVQHQSEATILDFWSLTSCSGMNHRRHQHQIEWRPMDTSYFSVNDGYLGIRSVTVLIPSTFFDIVCKHTANSERHPTCKIAQRSG